MSILIKDMEMPKYDTFHLTLLDDGTVCDGVWGDVVAQAVELPPHGRLIDADALKEFEFHGMQADKKISYQMGWNDAIATIAENAPTIIEAEWETTIEREEEINHSENDDNMDEVGRGWEKMR